MASELQERQEAEWQVLYDRIAAFLERYGKIGYKCGADFYLVEENLGWCHTIEAYNLTLLDPAIIKQLQDVLANYPDWETEIQVVLDGQEDTAPRMGLMVAGDEIIDALQRDLLPPEFRGLTYPGSKPGKLRSE